MSTKEIVFEWLATKRPMGRPSQIGVTLVADVSYTENRRLTSQGKEILLDGKHCEDAVTEEMAVAISDACEFAGLDFREFPKEAKINIFAAWS